jgi:beta-ureidopropionase / N-carbamoyl-L-amino-acid hydrolase
VASPAPLRCDRDRLWDRLAELARVGATPDGGVGRLALTDEDRAGRELVSAWAAELGLHERADRIGNLFWRRPGEVRDRAAVMAGSHLDTVPDGGRFDGAFGVLAALEAVQTLAEAGTRTAAPVEVACWANEEGARFPRVCTGSGAFAGAMTEEDVRALRATDGPAYGDELDRLGLAGPGAPGAERPSAYFEAHIEQGALLERAGIPIGVPEGIRAVRYLEATFEGEEAHAGGPMEDRRDALRAAARAIEELHALAAGDGLLAGAIVAAGRLEIEPNVPTVVPGRVRAWLCVRPAGLEGEEGWAGELERRLGAVAGELGVIVEVRAASRNGPARFDERAVALVRQGARALELETLHLVLPVGHDAGYLAGVAPTAMVLVPCRGGVSHSPDEWAERDWVGDGGDVLLGALRAAARG